MLLQGGYGGSKPSSIMREDLFNVHAHHTTRAFSKPGKSGDRETFQMEKSDHTAREYGHLPRTFQRFGQKVEKEWDIDFYRQRWIADRRHTGLIRITLTRPVSVKPRWPVLVEHLFITLPPKLGHNFLHLPWNLMTFRLEPLPTFLIITKFPTSVMFESAKEMSCWCYCSCRDFCTKASCNTHSKSML